MHLPKFEHLHPGSTEEVVHLLREYGARARLVAGGTDFFPRMKYGLICPEVIISMKGVPVQTPTVSKNGDLHLDGLMTLADVARSPIVQEKAPLLAEAALSVGSNQLRQMGTLGGNLCLENRCLYYNQTHNFQFVEPCFKRNGDRCYLIPEGKKCWAVFQADTVPALISLGAVINIAGPENGRQLPLEDFYTGDALKPLAISDTEFVTEVIVPGQASLRGGAFQKFTMRGGMEFAALNIAVVLDLDDDGILCHEGRISVGAILAAPKRMVKAEETMKMHPLSKELFQQVARMVASEARPSPHHGYSAIYLRECLKVNTLRALTLVSNRIEGLGK
jgi:4-hydroxybenzoyl-CoA reductase beta subunit